MQTNSLIALQNRVAQLEALCTSQQKVLGDISSKLSQLTALSRLPMEACHNNNNSSNMQPPASSTPSSAAPPAPHSSSSAAAQHSSTPKRLPPFSLVISAISEGFTNTDLAPFTIYTRDASNGGEWTEQQVEVALRLLDAQGVGVSGMTSPSPTVLLSEGKATVEGIRIETVSSKHGGAYKIEAKVTGPGEVVAEGIPVATSNPFVVWHERVKNNGKKALADLCAQDNLSQFPRIGRVYVDRFRDIDIHTVAQLAALPLSREDRRKCDQVLQSVRKDKGILTITRLDTYIRQARDVVARSQAANQGSHNEQRAANENQDVEEDEHLQQQLMALSKPGTKRVWEQMEQPAHQDDGDIGFGGVLDSGVSDVDLQPMGQDGANEEEGGVDNYFNQSLIASPDVDSWFANDIHPPLE